MKEFTNERSYVVAGLQRSGNHAVINWIARNLGDGVVFLNNAEPYTNPFATASPNVLTQYSDGLNFEAEKRSPSKKECIIVSYEDRHLSECFSGSNLKMLERTVGSSFRQFRLLILRDPLNFFASRLKAEEPFRIAENPLKRLTRRIFFKAGRISGIDRYLYRTNLSFPLSLPERIRLRLSHDTFARIPLIDDLHRHILIEFYKEYARTFLELRNGSNPGIVPVNFNEWCRSDDFRRELSKLLGLPSYDKGINERAVRSSFNESAIGEESKRWRRFIDDEFYREIVKDQELLDLTMPIFGTDVLQMEDLLP